jgi:hypothetical protein
MWLLGERLFTVFGVAPELAAPAAGPDTKLKTTTSEAINRTALRARANPRPVRTISFIPPFDVPSGENSTQPIGPLRSDRRHESGDTNAV